MNSFSKRIFDVVIAGSFTLGLFWIYPLIWCVIRFTSSGNPIYIQTRVGKNQKNFSCFKFRTMHVGTPERGTHETSPNALTSVGPFLRKTKLDELPQLYNVIVGDMSLVGPRPCLPIQQDVVRWRLEKNVFSVKPGITGLAQIRNIDMSTPEVLAATDAEYIQIASLTTNMKILLATLFGRGVGDRVVSSPIVIKTNGGSAGPISTAVSKAKDRPKSFVDIE